MSGIIHGCEQAAPEHSSVRLNCNRINKIVGTARERGIQAAVGMQSGEVKAVGAIDGSPLLSLKHRCWLLTFPERNRHRVASKQIPVAKVEHNAALADGDRGQ